jgi:hypothetical protein
MKKNDTNFNIYISSDPSTTQKRKSELITTTGNKTNKQKQQANKKAISQASEELKKCLS